MSKEIIVTGSSFSVGFEMSDHLLPDYQKLKQNFSPKAKRLKIYKWYLDNKNKSIVSSQIDKLAYSEWNKIMISRSWPAKLGEKTGLKITNLSVVAGSIGRNLIEYTNYLKKIKIKSRNQAIFAIHELPPIGRMYMRFDGKEKINILPNQLDDLESEWNPKTYHKEIQYVRQRYASLINKDTKTSFFKRHYHRCLGRLIQLSKNSNIQPYFIFYSDDDIPANFVYEKNIIIKNFKNFMEKFEKGPGGHPIDPAFNRNLVDEILSKIKT